MPFPTHQGTQAAVRAMLDVLGGLGRDTHLATYAEGAFEIDPSYVIHRARGAPGRQRFRSGPSLRKLAEDGQLALMLRRLAPRIAPDVVVAHHVEAAAACVAARVRPWLFVAHTDLGPELPTYGPRALGPLLRRTGTRVDRELCRRADAVAAISPALCARLGEHAERDVAYLPIPWAVPPPIASAERPAARAALGLAASDEVILYAGNLDAYQGWELLVAALERIGRQRPGVRLLVATASDTTPLDALAREAGVAGRVRTVDVGGEERRREIHAAADVAVVPRRAPGGLPIKLLDSLARGVPTVCAARAGAGLDLRGAAMIAADDDADALANGVLLALGAPEAALELGARGRRYVATDHAPQRFVEALDGVCRPLTAA